VLIFTILQRVEPLLCDDREIGKYTRAVSRQRLGKHVPAGKNRRAAIEILLGVSTWSVPRSYLEGDCGDPVSSVRESVKRGLEPDADE
jgi:hypothetical protein